MEAEDGPVGLQGSGASFWTAILPNIGSYFLGRDLAQDGPFGQFCVSLASTRELLLVPVTL